MSDIIVAAARTWIGTPYRHQASIRGVGCDCIGLVRGVLRDLGHRVPAKLPAYAPDWAETGGREILLEGLRRQFFAVDGHQRGPGRVVVFRWRDGAIAKHAGILTAADRMIHVHQGIPVCEVHLAERRRAAADGGEAGRNGWEDADLASIMACRRWRQTRDYSNALRDGPFLGDVRRCRYRAGQVGEELWVRHA